MIGNPLLLHLAQTSPHFALLLGGEQEQEPKQEEKKKPKERSSKPVQKEKENKC